MTPSIQPKAFYASDCPPRWSPDGERVLARLNGSLQVRTPGVEDAVSIGPKDTRLSDADWSPQGDTVTYSYYDRHQGQPEKHWGVLASSPEGGEERVFSSTGRNAAWSPDGSMVAYELVKKGAPRRLALMDAQGHDERVLADISVEQLDWNPNGKEILVSSRAITNSSLQVFNLETKTLKPLLPEETKSETNGVFSPDGSKVAFERKHTISGQTWLYVFDRETGQQSKVKTPTGRSFDPSWSPDGQSLVYTHRIPGQDFDLYKTDLRTSQITQLTEQDGDEYAPVFSPDGSRLAYYQTDNQAPRGQRESLQTLEP